MEMTPAEHELNGRNEPAPPLAPIPEAIARPKPRAVKDSSGPDLVEPSPSRPLPKKGVEKDELQAPPQDKEPVPVKRTDYEPSGGGLKWW
jgi:hypothetical protein